MTARAGWLIESATPLSTKQIGTARATAAAAGLTIEVRDSSDGANTLRTVATVVGALLALAIVAMTIGLIRSESAGDLRTLTATGAGPRTRRTLTASTAGALAFLGVVLGAGGAYIALLAGYHTDLSKLAAPPSATCWRWPSGSPSSPPPRAGCWPVGSPAPSPAKASTESVGPVLGTLGPVCGSRECREHWGVCCLRGVGHVFGPVALFQPRALSGLMISAGAAGRRVPVTLTTGTDHFSTGRR